MRLLSSLIFVSALIGTASAACDTSFMQNTGNYTYQMVAAGQTSTMTSQVTKKGDGFVVHSVVDGKAVDATYKCENGVLKTDMQGLQMGVSNMPAANKWRVGYGWTSNMTMSGAGGHGMNSTTAYKITKMESVKTPAGTFNAFRIESDTTMKMDMKDMPKGMKVPGLSAPIHGVMWYAKGVGMVKTTGPNYTMTLIKVSK